MRGLAVSKTRAESAQHRLIDENETRLFGLRRLDQRFLRITANNLMEDVSRIIVPAPSLGSLPSGEDNEPRAAPRPVFSRAIDIDGDGLTELIVVSQDGPYWSTLRIYRFSTPDSLLGHARFHEIARLTGILNYKIKTSLNANPNIVVDIDDPDSDLPHAANVNLLRQTHTWKNGKLALTHEEKRTKSYTTREMNQDVSRDIDELLTIKNDLFTEVLNSLNSHQELREQAIEADTAFRSYLDNETAWHSNLFSGGSIRGIAGAKVKMRLLNERNKLLEDWLKREEGDMW
ncbi:hypothetical protein [Synechococcus sp. RedBA-s]|uniref:hypothetical protein n=1 Tax=Synechococcus sp. RedBA-s TaxID=2823741 RepID=UPI0020CB801B|nr:hypothetical protein [Synechococcus sp. RedBA-s]MCP9801547.1 hypothetical protein [Synechococcus sp. RedBA-s]